VAFVGAFMCSRDSAETISSSHQDTPVWYSLFGDSLAILSALGGLGYIMLGKSLRDHVEVYVFMTINMLVGSHMILFYMYCTNDTFTFDAHIDHGVYGWTHTDFDRLPVELCVVFICNLCGTMGYVRAFKYFSSVIIAVAALLEPVTATLLAIVLQVGVFPGWLGRIGNVMVIVGTLMVIYPSAVEEEDDDDELRQDRKAEMDENK
jgi:drug/metabolite transporter (DMT)-like permease